MQPCSAKSGEGTFCCSTGFFNSNVRKSSYNRLKRGRECRKRDSEEGHLFIG